MESSSETTPNTTDWKSAKFFKDIVVTDLQIASKNFTILDVKVANATEKTAGYMSLMHRVTLEVQLGSDGGEQRKQLNYIVKEKSGKVFGGEMVEIMSVFPKEIYMYSNILPAFEELWKGDLVKFGPKMFKVTSTPFTVIVMEDLRLSGYRMKECNAGLNLEDCEKVLEKMAKFHAASVVYYEENGPYPEDFKDGMFSERLITMFEQYYEPLFDSYLQALEELRYPAEIIESLKLFRGKVYSTVSKLFRLDSSKFNVLNHGDTWINNIQFNDRDLLLLDYQISFYGSPSYDLLYFIINSGSLSVRTEKFDHLIDHYFSHLAAGLKKLGAKTPTPTRQQLNEDIAAHGFMVCVLSVEGLAMMLALPELDLDMEMLSSKELEGIEYRRKLYTNERFVKMIEKLMPFMWERGFLKEQPKEILEDVF